MDNLTGDHAVARAERVTPIVRATSDATEAACRLVPELLKALHEERIFRVLLPSSLGGDELDPVTLSCVTEAIAAEDASTGWCVGQAAGCAMTAAFLDPVPAQEIFGPDNSVLAWGAGAQGQAIKVDGGYRVTGKWPFASGSRHATWLGAHSCVCDADGTRQVRADGKPLNRTALFTRDKAAIVDNWQVVGLRGTGSDTYSVENLFVPDEHTIDRDDPAELRTDGHVYRMSMVQVFAFAFAGVMLGIARGALDDLSELAQKKTPRGAASSLLSSQMFHGQYGDLEARLRSARAYVHITGQQYWDVVTSGGQQTMELRAALRLAMTHAINQGVDVVTDAYRLAGQNAIFENARFERRLRDANAASQQVQARKTHYATVGQTLLGLPPDSEMFI